MTDAKTFGTSTPSEDLAAKIAAGEIFAGDIIAEFANGHDAADFARMKGADDYTVTPGINFVFAVRPWVKRERQTWYFSFGQAHVHEVDGVTLDKDSLVAIKAPSAGAARQLMFNTFGRRWAMQRGHDELADALPHFPRGIVLELEVL